ncbi:transposase [Arthrobacter sp. NPDC057013]|uniref:IS110 family transposase n=1 Tax=Arthrobacter sp. NPDC057013 TaxID=3345999 RepID=UPI0036416EB5
MGRLRRALFEGWKRTHVGLDVHALTVVACGIDGLTGEIFRTRLTPDHGEVLAWIQALPGPVKVVYEVGPTGFPLARTLRAADVDCLVAAPSKLQRPSGDRVKTDRNDALHLARLLKLDQIRGRGSGAGTGSCPGPGRRPRRHPR